ncbi:histidinol-phosphate transaminase [Myroides indicus]|uniref:Histidinol-phosphate aminotransferase n=1 Tax=Myroides indicus TaxID=1323422 RepID=A0A4R7ESY6_9FLAO|nr:histidinol-phosphate transaminase [Myroides indicus]TDS56915.1 histidinol-phosphate aminotransferase [Myroides indicus]
MKNKIVNLVRSDILNLSPYQSAREEYTYNKACFLDANESPYGLYNRYPDPFQNKLKIKISKIKNIGIESIFIGNGSDEPIDMVYRIFCNPRQDKVLIFNPTYGMYSVYAAINGVDIIYQKLNEDFQIDNKSIDILCQDKEIKLIFICNPNNPTGTIIAPTSIEKILNTFNSIVVIDEAYIDFCPEYSWLPKLKRYPNLIIIQTLSKAWGMAGLRIGLAFMSPDILYFFNKIKSPYNISEVNQREATEILKDQCEFQTNIKLIKQETIRVVSETEKLSIVTKVYPTQTNFILVEFKNAQRIYDSLISKQIVVRNRSSQIPNTLRITVGNKKENNTLIQTLKQLDNE